jgi:hypothetical protein
MLSDVWERELRGDFAPTPGKRVVLHDVPPAAFPKLLNLACGAPATPVSGLPELVDLALLADRFALDPVRAALEEEAVRRLTPDAAAGLVEALSAASTGLTALPRAAADFACAHFEALAATDGFLALGEPALLALLDADRLAADGEERVYEALARWLRAAPGRLLGPGPAGLLAAIRFPRMSREYLARRAVPLLPELPALPPMVREALEARAAAAARRRPPPRVHLGRRALAPRAPELARDSGLGRAWG